MARSRLLVDLGPFRRFPQFRLLWSGYLVSTLGNQLTVVAVPYQIYRITHSSLDVGLVSLVQIGPLLLGSFVGGTVADSFDRRRLLMVSQVLLASTSLGLALNALGGHPELWPLFVCSACQAGFSGIDSPTRAALVVSVVDRDTIVGANALWQVLFQVGQIAGPAVAGVLLGRFGVGPVYWVDLASFAASLASIVRLRSVPKTLSSPGRTFGLEAMVGGLRFIRGQQALQAIFLVDLNAMVFGMPRALFPALGLTHFHGGAGTVGLLYSAPGAGALVGALLTGWVARVRRQGLAVLCAVTVWGGAIAAFGIVPMLPVALVLLGVAGAADVVSAVFRSTILQVVTPERLLGRLQAVQTAVVTGGPRLGDVEAGVVASLAGTEVSVVSGGLLCVLGVVVLARAVPSFARLQLGSVPSGGTDGAGDAGAPIAVGTGKGSGPHDVGCSAGPGSSADPSGSAPSGGAADEEDPDGVER